MAIVLLFFKWFQPAWIDEARLLTQGQALSCLPIRWSGRCLNAGAGGGLYRSFLDHHPAITSVDEIDLVAPIPPPDLRKPHRAVAGSLVQLPYPPQSFDCCLCSEVLEHIPDDVRAVSELSRVLKPGACLVVTVPTPPAPADPNHVREGYRLEDLTALLAKSGLRITHHRYIFHQVMRILWRSWSWQHHTLGGGQKTYFPRFLLRFGAAFDRALPLGKPWDLIVVAEKIG